MISTRTPTSTSRCGDRRRARARLVVPVLLIGLVSTLALAAGATSASAASPGSAQRAAASDDCIFGVICLPGQTPSPTATPSAPATTSPANPIFPAPTTTTTPPATGGAAGSGSGSGLQLGAATAQSCDRSAFPAKSATSNTAKLDYAAAMGTCQQAVKAGDAEVKATAAGGALPTPTDHVTHIDATKLTVDGFAFQGVQTLTTSSGASKRVLVFTADKAQIEGMDQSYTFNGGTVHVQNPGGTAVLQGNVKLYVTTFYSKIFSLVPITFTPDFAPPLVLPSMFFTDVSTDNAYITCDQILLSNAKIPVS